MPPAADKCTTRPGAALYEWLGTWAWRLMWLLSLQNGRRLPHLPGMPNRRIRSELHDHPAACNQPLCRPNAHALQ